LNLVEAAYMSAAESTVEYFQNSLPEQKTWGFRLLAGSPDPQEANDINITRVPVILNNLRKAFDYVFIDIGRSLSANISLPIIVKADQAVLILGPDESTVALTKVIWRYLQSKGMKKFQLYPLINRAVGLEGLTKSEIEAELDITIPSSIPYAGGSFTMANNQNVPLSFRFPDDVATMAIRQTALEIETRAREVKEQRVRV
jgi:MinD-like ATPase involved in chromosome partitioning or flagellar assembly